MSYIRYSIYDIPNTHTQIGLIPDTRDPYIQLVMTAEGLEPTKTQKRSVRRSTREFTCYSVYWSSEVAACDTKLENSLQSFLRKFFVYSWRRCVCPIYLHLIYSASFSALHAAPPRAARNFFLVSDTARQWDWSLECTCNWGISGPASYCIASWRERKYGQLMCWNPLARHCRSAGAVFSSVMRELAYFTFMNWGEPPSYTSCSIPLAKEDLSHFLAAKLNTYFVVHPYLPCPVLFSKVFFLALSLIVRKGNTGQALGPWAPLTNLPRLGTIRSTRARRKLRRARTSSVSPTKPSRPPLNPPTAQPTKRLLVGIQPNASIFICPNVVSAP